MTKKRFPYQPNAPITSDPYGEFLDVRESQARVPAGLSRGAMGKGGASHQINPKLTPEKQSKVSSFFDTRPINGTDFFQTGGSIAFSTTALLNDTETATFSYTIPTGFVAVLRGFLWQFDPVYVQGSIVSIKTFLTIDGNGVPHYNNIQDVQYRDNFVPSHLIIDQNKTLQINTVRISNIALATRSLTVNDVFYRAEFYGNVLQKRNLPQQFEVGSY